MFTKLLIISQLLLSLHFCISLFCYVRWVFLHLFTVARSSSKYLSFVIIINHKIIFCMEDKGATVSTVSPQLLQSRNLDLDSGQTSNSNGALTLKWAEVRTVISRRADGTQNIQVDMDSEDQFLAACKQGGWGGWWWVGLLFAMSGRLRAVPQTVPRWRWCELPGRGAPEGGHHQQPRDHLDPGDPHHHHHHHYHHDDAGQLLDCPRLDLELRDQNGRTALHVACWYNKVSVKRRGRCTKYRVE